MKLIVKSTFIDKNDHTTMYRVGTVLDLNDEERCADLIKRGLCEEVKASKESDKSEAPKVDEPKAAEDESDKSEAPKVDEPKAAKPKRGGGSKGSKK